VNSSPSVAQPGASESETSDPAFTDPLVRSSIREALMVTAIWLIAGTWSISVCYLMGYNRSVESLKLVLGFPDWIFWGIVIPWTTCTVASILFGLIFIRDGDLGQDLENADDLGLGG
jgi:hypothetical protein